MGQVYRNAGIEAARIAGNSPQMDATAQRTRGAILGVLASHNKTGHYASGVHTSNVRGRNGVRDRLVEVTDPNALSIEYGHWWITPLGIKVKWIKGLRIVNRAFDLMKGGK